VGQFGCLPDPFVAEGDLVEVLVPAAEALEDLHRVIDGRFRDLDLLEATGEGPSFSNTIGWYFVVGRRNRCSAACPRQGPV
jgi:hypothetical protein